MVKPQEIESNGYYSNLQARRFVVRRGWDQSIANELVERSQEEQIVARYARDSRKRFLDTESAERWAIDHQPVIYTLALARAAEVAAALWIIPPEEKLPGIERSFSLRMYESVRGRDLAVDFGKAALLDYEVQNPDYEGDLGVKVEREYTDEISVLRELGFNPGTKIRSSDPYVTLVRPGYHSRSSDSIKRTNSRH